MSTDREVFWTKFNEMDKKYKKYENGNDIYEMISTLIILKFNTDAAIAFSKFPNWFEQDNKKYIDRLLRKFPQIWNHFSTPEYYQCLKDKDKRKLYMFKILSHI